MFLFIFFCCWGELQLVTGASRSATCDLQLAKWQNNAVSRAQTQTHKERKRERHTLSHLSHSFTLFVLCNSRKEVTNYTWNRNKQVALGCEIHLVCDDERREGEKDTVRESGKLKKNRRLGFLLVLCEFLRSSFLPLTACPCASALSPPLVSRVTGGTQPPTELTSIRERKREREKENLCAARQPPPQLESHCMCYTQSRIGRPSASNLPNLSCLSLLVHLPLSLAFMLQP